MSPPLKLRRVPGAAWVRRQLVADRLPATLLAAAVAGILGALATVAFRESLEFLQAWISGAPAHGMVSLARGLAWWERLLLPALGGVVAGLILQWANTRLPRRGAGDYMEAIAVGRGIVGMRQTLARSLASLSSISSGASIGREGPMVQLAAMLSSVLGRFLVLPPGHLRLLVACGATAGITAAYNAPIAGALFVSEIVYGAVSSATLVPLIVSSVAANMVTRQLLNYDAVYHMPAFDFVSGWEVLSYLGLGLLAGVTAPYYLALLDGAKQGFTRLIRPVWAQLAAGGLLVGAISIGWPEVWGNGYSVVNSMLHQPWAWQAVAILLLMKIVATAGSVGSGAVGGIFTPTLFVGAAVGHLYGVALHGMLPAGSVSSVSSYAVVGMGALLAASTHAPLMSILMIFEMTLSYEAMLPLMLACVTGFVIARGLRPDSMYSRSLARNRRVQALLGARLPKGRED